MNEEQDKLKNIGKGLLKLFFKKTIVIGVIVLVLIVLSGSMYVVKKEAFENASDTSQTYSGSVNGQGQTVVVKTEEDGTQTPATIDDIVDEVQPILEPYMDGSDEEKSREIIKTIIQAELITKQPYRDLVPEGETNGQIKFYRYTDAEDEVNADDIKEEKRLKYMPLADFKAKIEAYKSNAEANQDVFKYFTIDENQKVLIACGEEKHRKIITGVDGTEKDLDLTVDIINQESTANSTYSGTPASGFEAREYTIIEKTIDYLPLIEQYIMPSNLLYALLIQTEDEDFVKAIADLACGNEIAIGIYDNKTHSESTKTYTYKKLMKINVKTSLNYKDTLVSITDSQPAIEIKYNDLSSLPYEYIPIYCETQTIESENAEENGKINHMVIYKKEGDEPRTLHDDSMYINGTNYNNEITGLGEGKIFKTTYTITTDVTSTPTAGILLADTWVAKWEETYTKKSNNTPEEASPETDLENKEIATYTDDNSLYLAFSQNFRSSMAAKLSSHATELREEAIHRIIDATPESTYEAELENVTFDDTEKKAVLTEHLAECSECPTWVSNEGLTEDIDTIFSKITTSPTGELVNVKNHYEAKWDEYVEEKEAEAEQNAVNKTSERKAEFERQLHVPETISYNITLSGNKQYVNIKFSSSSSTNYSEYEKSGKIERTEEGVKFSNIFNTEEFHSARQMLFETEEWFWENIRENEDTAKLEDTLRYLLNKATNSTNYGTYTDEEIEEIFGIFEPEQTVIFEGNTISPFGTILTREEFIQSVQSHNGGTYYSNLSNAAEDFYDICTLEKYNINPCVAFSWACIETEYGKNIPYNNLFGMAVYNGEDSGTVYNSYKESIEDFCEWVIRNAELSETYSQAQRFATVNSKFKGTPKNNIYALFCRYMYLGDTHIADEPDFNNPAGNDYYESQGSNWGSGGRIYLYYMYECGGLYTGEYATRCGHSEGTDETTLQEKADYVQYSVETRIKIAKDIFGNAIFVTGEGIYESINDECRWGIYTSSSGRTYTEWIQTTRNSYGQLPLFSKQTDDNGNVIYDEDGNPKYVLMGKSGCNVYGYTMLLNSVGADITPKDAHAAYKSFGSMNNEGTMTKLLQENNINATVKTIALQNGGSDAQAEFISVLQEGRGILTRVGPGIYTSSGHWLVAADIRETQLDSTTGYDIFILTSSSRSKRTRMAKNGDSNGKSSI